MSATRKLTMAQAISEGIAMEMTPDPNVFVMGEDSGVYVEGSSNEVPEAAYTILFGPARLARTGRDLTIMTPADGRIEKILVKAGDTFAQGKPIALPTEAP